jgi:hypothetical protein
MSMAPMMMTGAIMAGGSPGGMYGLCSLLLVWNEYQT